MKEGFCGISSIHGGLRVTVPPNINARAARNSVSKHLHKLRVRLHLDGLHRQSSRGSTDNKWADGFRGCWNKRVINLVNKNAWGYKFKIFN